MERLAYKVLGGLPHHGLCAHTHRGRERGDKAKGGQRGERKHGEGRGAREVRSSGGEEDEENEAER